MVASGPNETTADIDPAIVGSKLMAKLVDDPPATTALNPLKSILNSPGFDPNRAGVPRFIVCVPLFPIEIASAPEGPAWTNCAPKFVAPEAASPFEID